MNLKQKWWLLSILGLLLVGAGLSIFGEALRLKMIPEANFTSWFWIGTLSLILINSGLSIFGRAIVYRVQMENIKKQL